MSRISELEKITDNQTSKETIERLEKENFELKARIEELELTNTMHINVSSSTVPQVAVGEKVHTSIHESCAKNAIVRMKKRKSQKPKQIHAISTVTKKAVI